MIEIHKKVTAVLLCLILLFSAVGAFSANAAEPQAKLFYSISAVHQYSVLIVCWDCLSAEVPTVGSIPDVTLDYTDANGTVKTITVEKDKILLEIYGVQTGKDTAEQFVPQLTVCLPVIQNSLPCDTRVSVCAGAFRTSAGEPFPAVTAFLSDLSPVNIGLKWTTEVLEDADQSIEGQKMSLEPQISDPWLCSVWMPHLTLTDNGHPVENQYTLQGSGTHTICAALNPFLSAAFTITTVSEKEAFRINTRYHGKRMGEATLALLGGIATLPLYFTGMPFFLSLMMLSGGLTGYENFFHSLFRTKLLTKTLVSITSN